VYFATPTCGSLAATKKFVVENKIIVAHAYNALGLRMPLVQYIRPGDKILLAYGDDGRYSPFLCCTAGAAEEPVITEKHHFDVFACIDKAHAERLEATGYSPDPVVKQFTGIVLASVEEAGAVSEIQKPKGSNTLRRSAEVFR
jgi:hypothetical protein